MGVHNQLAQKLLPANAIICNVCFILNMPATTKHRVSVSMLVEKHVVDGPCLRVSGRTGTW